MIIKHNKNFCRFLNQEIATTPTSDTFTEVMTLQGQIFRQVKSRKTLRFVKNDKAYFAKLHFGIGWREIIKDLVQLRLPVLGAKNEWQAIQRLDELSVETLTLVGYGRQGYNPARQQSFIITEELIHTISLEDFCRNWKTQAPDFNLKRALIAKVANIALKIHSHGLNHRDFYLCHFLLQLPIAESVKDAAQLTVFLTDLHRMQIRHKVPKRWLIKDLAGLYFSAMDIGLSQRDLWYFLKLYYQKPLRAIFSTQAKLLVKIAVRAKKLYAKTYFQQRKNLNSLQYYDQRYAGLELNQVLQNPDSTIVAGKLLKHDATTTLALIQLGEITAVLKRYNAKSFWHRLRRAIKASRAANCWNAAQELLRLDFSTPRPIAIIEKRYGWLRGDAYYLMEYLPGDLLSEIFKDDNPLDAKQQSIMAATIRLLKRLARHKISHGDLKATNILVVSKDKIALLDLDAMRQHRCAWLNRRAQARDWRRFLKNWQNQSKVLDLIPEKLG